METRAKLLIEKFEGLTNVTQDSGVTKLDYKNYFKFTVTPNFKGCSRTTISLYNKLNSQEVYRDLGLNFTLEPYFKPASKITELLQNKGLKDLLNTSSIMLVPSTKGFETMSTLPPPPKKLRGDWEPKHFIPNELVGDVIKEVGLIIDTADYDFKGEPSDRISDIRDTLKKFIDSLEKDGLKLTRGNRKVLDKFPLQMNFNW